MALTVDIAGGRRGLGLNEERDQTLNQLLTELDGFEARPGVLLLAATNRTEVTFTDSSHHEDISSHLDHI